MADHSSRNPRSSQGVYAPLEQRPTGSAGPNATWSERFEFWLGRRHGSDSSIVTAWKLLKGAVICLYVVGFLAASLYGLGLIFSPGPSTSFEKEVEAKANAERAAFLDPQTGASEIERRMRAEIKYQDGTLLIGQDGFPEIVVSANSPWAVECERGRPQGSHHDGDRGQRGERW